jgi:hypothetical protein
MSVVLVSGRLTGGGTVLNEGEASFVLLKPG